MQPAERRAVRKDPGFLSASLRESGIESSSANAGFRRRAHSQAHHCLLKSSARRARALGGHDQRKSDRQATAHHHPTP